MPRPCISDFIRIKRSFMLKKKLGFEKKQLPGDVGMFQFNSAVHVELGVFLLTTTLENASKTAWLIWSDEKKCVNHCSN
jgi:hypothetical protein